MKYFFSNLENNYCTRYNIVLMEDKSNMTDGDSLIFLRTVCLNKTGQLIVASSNLYCKEVHCMNEPLD